MELLKTVKDTKILVGGACVAGDVLSNSVDAGTCWVFRNIARNNQGSGYITRALALLQTTALTPRLTLFLFNAVPTSMLNDNVANTAPNPADEEKYIGWVDFPAMSSVGTGMSEAMATPSTPGNLPIPFICNSGDTNLYGIVATNDAVTPTALDKLTIKLTVQQE